MKRQLKTIYALIPFKRQLFILLKRFWSPPEKIYRHLHFKGNIRIPVKRGRHFYMRHYGFYIENEIFWNGLTGGWERVSLETWIELCRQANCVMDIGANTGLYALIAKTMNPNARVYAFEPVKRVYDKLVYNSELNAYDIKCHEVAVSNTDSTATIYDTPAEHTYSVTVNKNLNEPGAAVFSTTVKTQKLATLIKEEQLPAVNLIKIDVEGHEPEVLEGMGEYLDKFRPTMLIEILDNEIAEKIMKHVSGMGYLFFNIDDKAGITPIERLTTSENGHQDYIASEQRSHRDNFLLCREEIARQLKLLP